MCFSGPLVEMAVVEFNCELPLHDGLAGDTVDKNDCAIRANHNLFMFLREHE